VPEASDDTATCRFPGSDSFVAIPLFVSELQFFPPLLLFARGSPLFLDVIAVAEQCFQKFPSTVYQYIFWTVAFVTVRFSFLSFDYSEKED